MATTKTNDLANARQDLAEDAALEVVVVVVGLARWFGRQELWGFRL